MKTIGYFVSYKLYYHSFTEIAVIIDSNEEDQGEVILSIKHRYKTIEKDVRIKNFTLFYAGKIHHMSMIKLPNSVKASLSMNLILIFFLIIFTRII